MSTTPAELAHERYGRRRPWPRRRLVGTLAAIMLVTIGWATWTAVRLGSPAVSWQDIGFSVVSDGAAQMTFDVTFAGRVNGSAHAVCTLEAQNELHTDVGLRDVTVGPASRRQLRVTATLPTSERATAVLVKACIVP